MRALSLLGNMLAAGLMAVPASASAEVLNIQGIYPARNDGAAALRSIAVEAFGGIDGPALSIHIGDALRDVQIEGRPWFRILAGGPASRAEAVLRGTASSEVANSQYSQQREECAAKDGGGKCIEKRKVDVPCNKRRIELVPNLRLVLPDGELLYADDEPESAETSRCRGDSSEPKPRAAVVRDLAARIASRTRFAFAPVFRSESIRVNESRKGLSREDSDRFKQAVRLTKSDARAACSEWDAIAATNPGHIPTLFNAALCAEAAGTDAEAARRYRLLLESDPRHGDAREGLTRIDARARARRQLESHERS